MDDNYPMYTGYPQHHYAKYEFYHGGSEALVHLSPALCRGQTRPGVAFDPHLSTQSHQQFAAYTHDGVARSVWLPCADPRWAYHACHAVQPLPITGTEKLDYPFPQTNVPTPWSMPQSPIESPITPPVSTPKKDHYCQFCQHSFHRWQERDRHEQTHLPYFFHCPLPHCDWRGNRIHTFKTHWKQKDHLPYHRIHGRSPERSKIETYDPRTILNKLRRGTISLEEVSEEAILLVQVKAYETGKLSMLTDPRVRSRKQQGPNGRQWGEYIC